MGVCKVSRVTLAVSEKSKHAVRVEVIALYAGSRPRQYSHSTKGWTEQEYPRKDIHISSGNHVNETYRA